MNDLLKEEIHVEVSEKDVYDIPIEDNLHVSALTPSEVREALNKIPAKYAYWATKLDDLDDDIAVLQTKWDLWYGKLYGTVEEENPRRTKEYCKHVVFTNNMEKVKKFNARMRRLRLARSKLSTLVKSIEMQSRTLQSVSSSQRREMDMLTGGGTPQEKAQGRRDLEEDF